MGTTANTKPSLTAKNNSENEAEKYVNAMSIVASRLINTVLNERHLVNNNPTNIIKIGTNANNKSIINDVYVHNDL